MKELNDRRMVYTYIHTYIHTYTVNIGMKELNDRRMVLSRLAARSV